MIKKNSQNNLLQAINMKIKFLHFIFISNLFLSKQKLFTNAKCIINSWIFHERKVNKGNTTENLHRNLYLIGIDGNQFNYNKI